MLWILLVLLDARKDCFDIFLLGDIVTWNSPGCRSKLKVDDIIGLEICENLKCANAYTFQIGAQFVDV